jgi:hypothetical protein
VVILQVAEVAENTVGVELAQAALAEAVLAEINPLITPLLEQ